MNIRRILPTDDAEWLRMRDALWPGLSIEDHRSEMAGCHGDTACVFVIDRGDGRLGGFIEVDTHPYADGCTSSPVGYIEGWFVDIDLRQSGLGGALVAAGEEWARSKGYTEMASDCLLDNKISFQAHTALGYRETCRLICFSKSLVGQDATSPEK